MATFNDYSEADLAGMSDEDFNKLFIEFTTATELDRKENQIEYYKPVSEDGMRIHMTPADLVGIGGGNGSGKSESVLAEMIMCATGIFPQHLKDKLSKQYGPNWWKAKSPGPMNCRVIIASLTAMLEMTFLPKLRWDEWTGVLPEGGDKGHWGWIPKRCLIDGKWDHSWKGKNNLLHFKSFHPITGEERGISHIQFMSNDQDAKNMVGNDLQFVMLDEPSTYPVFLENQARTMRGNGRIFLSMTWPDDPTIPVDWIFDEIYEPGKKQAMDLKLTGTEPEIEWIELKTRDNGHLNQEKVERQAARWDDKMKSVRLEGQPIRFSNLVHPLYTGPNNSKIWCFDDNKEVYRDSEGSCMTCGGKNTEEFCHTYDFEIRQDWPVIFILDPHPRKPHMMQWVAVDPNDNFWQIAELMVDDTPDELAKQCRQIENDFRLVVQRRLIDPNMGRSPSSAKEREITWQDEFARCGIVCELASDSSVGRSKLDEWLKPDPSTREPRIYIHERCVNTIFQMKRFRWDEFKITQEKDQKQDTKKKDDDFPTNLKYLANNDPTFQEFGNTGKVINTRFKK
tara:strand:- start:13281 stop:14978 length:1698 start_codon:yes stop_codon:yes gene_type:complete